MFHRVAIYATTAALLLLLLGKATDATSVARPLYPLLYFGADDVADLRARKTGSHAKIYVEIERAAVALKSDPDYYLPPETTEQFGSKWNEIYGNNLCTFAMFSLLNPDDAEAFELVRDVTVVKLLSEILLAFAFINLTKQLSG